MFATSVGDSTRAWRGGLAAKVVGALAATVLLGACASKPAPAPSRTATSSAIPTPDPLPAGATSVPVAADWPEQDTPFAQAPSQMQLAWAAYGVTIIPSRHVFDSMAAPPQVLNKTNGVLTQAQVQQIALAYNRTDALWGWADAHNQPKLQVYLSNAGFLNTPAGQAEAQGEAVIDPKCDLYPTKMSVFPVDAGIKAFVEAHGYTVSATYALVSNFSTPCSITAQTSKGSQTIYDWAFGLNVVVESGNARNDPVLGLAYFAEGARACPNSGYPTPEPGESFPPGMLPTPGGEGGPSACYVFGG